MNKEEDIEMKKEMDELTKDSDQVTNLRVYSPDYDPKNRQLEATDGNLKLTVNRSRGTKDTIYVSVNERDTGRMIFRASIDRTEATEADLKSFPWKVRLDAGEKDGHLGTLGYGEFIL